MKILKKFIFLFTSMLLIAVFFIPVTVYAADESSTTETTTESAIPDESKPFTPDGQGTVLDLAYEGDGKMFYTFTTPAGNVFYLIIDRERGSDNVYFLNAVTEADLLALAEKSSNSGGISVIPTTEPPTVNKSDENSANSGTAPSKQKSNTGLLIFLLIGVAAMGGVAYYIKIVRPKKQANVDNEDDDIPTEENGDEIEFENEPEETDEDSDNTDE